MSDDWNSDGLNDSYDEAHEFGIDLDGGGGGVGGVGDDGDDGFDLGLVEIFDAADLLGADLVAGMALAGDGGGLVGPEGLDVPAVALPFGDAFARLVERLGAEPLPTHDLLGYIAGLSVRNPFIVEVAPTE